MGSTLIRDPRALVREACSNTSTDLYLYEVYGGFISSFALGDHCCGWKRIWGDVEKRPVTGVCDAQRGNGDCGMVSNQALKDFMYLLHLDWSFR
jgi:hypothetical protein